MVGGKRVEFGVQINIGSLDPDSRAGRVRDFDIRVNLCNRYGQRRPPIDDGVFSEEDDLSGRGSFGHEFGWGAVPPYER
jgi:hypothetical protein